MKIFTITSAITVLSTLISVGLAQEGATPGGTQTGPSTYSCDPNTCKLPKCQCASQSPPGGLKPSDTPQFVVITFDDSVQGALLQTAKDMLNVKNPNGCPAKGSWYVSMEYTDFSLVQQWYADGNEVADHTFTHVGNPSAQEITAAKEMLHTYGGVPYGKITGFRAPFLNYTASTLSTVAQQGFMYDTSSTATLDDCFWPYTLDNGMANDCWTGICAAGQVKLPGVWELPMYAVMDNASTPQLMDVYLAGSMSDVTTWSQTNFQRHYTGNRQPFGIYVHPTHMTNYPGMPDVSALKNGVVSIIQSLAGKPDVWFVTNQQLLQWMQNPVPNSQLASQPYMQCNVPNTGKEICNGLQNITVSSDGLVQSPLLQNCNFNTTNWHTCYNCPNAAPSLDTPVPPAAVQSTDPSYRKPVPDNCDSIWWDPVAGQCLCTNSSCAYTDTAAPTNGSSNGTSANGSGSKSAAAPLTKPMLGGAVTLAVAALATLLF
ncbi:hypothetical protein DM01DRAFT_1319238 [Hesseltinella vesiculosa]|uniref:NodB homology domain-containing protein n=1 Tax=Hesseltinella vesiculosa TaxID=101127 RepID=A0A1X2GML3_9FUNG|nr:hypothetical protein DM01DRAFT_1319238 [Hesseltinella vesiculosa]